MRDIQNKTDGTGDILTADAFNANYIDELQRVAETADFTLDVEAGPDTDLHMFTKSIVIYASASNYYDDTGAINAFVLDRSNNLEPFPSYVDGMLLTFKASTTNTGACTVNVDSLGVKSLTDSAGSVLSPGDITVNNYITIRYDSGNDRFETVVTPVIGGGGGLTSWEENGTTFRPTSSGYDIGDSTHLVGDFYIGNLNYIYAEDFGSTLRTVLGIDGSSVFQIGNTNIATNIQSNGTLTHNTVDLITDLLPAQATHTGEYLQTDGAGTLSWAVVGAGGLISWEENSDDFRPIVTKTGNLGDSTHLVEGAYFMDDGFVYFGDSQDASIRWYNSGTSFYFSSSAYMDFDVGTDLSIAVTGDFYIDNTGDFFINTNPAQDVYFQFSSTTHWQLSNSGPILPGGSNPSADIGSTTAEIENVYISDTGAVYFGSDQDMSINHDGSNGYINVSTGALRINGCDVSIDNLLAYQCENNVGTAFDMASIDGSNVAQIANTSLATNIRSNGTLTHNTVDLITSLLPAQATHAGEFLQTDGAGTLSWAAAGGSGLTSWEENTNDLRPVTTKTGALGDSTHLIEGLFIMDNGPIYVGDSQDIEISHDATDSHFINNTGDLYVENLAAANLYLTTNSPANGWYLDSSGNFLPDTTATYTIGTTALRVNKGWFVDGEFTNLPTINGGVFITAALPSQATHAGEFLQTDGAGTLSWAAVSALSSWEESSDDLRPVVSGTGNLGDATHLIEGAYFNDNATINLGASQDIRIYHDSTNSYIENRTGVFNIGTFSALTLQFYTNSINQWAIQGTGELVPGTAGAKDIGTTALEVRNIYQSDSGHHYLGSDQDMDIYHSGSVGYIYNGTGVLRVGTTAANAIYFDVNSTTRWTMDSSGHLVPNGPGVYNIGSTAAEVNHIYQADSAIHYFGSDQDLEIYHDGTNAYINNSTGYINITDGNFNFYNTGEIRFENNVGTSFAALRVDGSDIAHISNANFETTIYAATTINISSADVHLNDNYELNLGDGNDLRLYHDGTDSYVMNAGVLYVGSSAYNAVRFRTDDTDRWFIGATGHLIPNVNNTYQLGTSSNTIGAIYSLGVYNTTTSARDVYVDATGQLGYLTSAAKSKENIGEIPDTEWIYDLDPKMFNYINDPEKRTEYGLIADEVEKIRPELVFYDIDENGNKEVAGINYRCFYAVLINEIKKLKNELNNINRQSGDLLDF